MNSQSAEEARLSRVVSRIAWWFMGCPVSRRVSWNVQVRGMDFGTNGWIPWDYRLGMRLAEVEARLRYRPERT